MSLSLRIKELRELKGLSKGAFADTIKIDRSQFTKIEGGKLTPTIAQLMEISSIFNVSIDWLLTGEGEMFKKVDSIASLNENYEDKKSAIYLYDISASAGFGSFDEMVSQEKIVGKYIVPDFRNVDWMISVKGSSMYPKYSSGDIIACRVIHDSKFIQWGKVYVIATIEQGLLVKRLEECDDNEFLLAVSDNKNYKPFPIPKSEIVGIALVVGVIRME